VHIMWDTYVGEEWARQLPLLNESIQAFQRTDLSDLTLYEAIRVVAGRDMRGRMDDEEAEIDHVIFSPAPHLGPYIAKLIDGNTLRVLYNARLPRGAQAQSSALSRSEVLIRMSALADDTRLRILEMLTKRDEMRAQDIIEALDLSQSSVSRHLSQLSATGFLIERRRDVNKFYSLNVDRVVDTVRALTNFLARQ
jgi:DNA-binding transcriptional ArsR family regulator